MPEVATVQVEKVWGPRQAGKGKVYDFKFQDEKWSAWNKVGEELAAVAPGTITVEYELRPNAGYNNPTVLNILSSTRNAASTQDVNGSAASTNQTAGFAQDDRSKQINRSVAFKGAVDLYVASERVTGTLEDIVAVAELTQGLLDVVEGTFTVSDGEFTPEDS